MSSSESGAQKYDGAPSVSISWLGTKSVSSKEILSESKHGQLFSNINKKARPTIVKNANGSSSAQ